MYYPDELVEEIRSRSDIVSVLSRFIPLQKKGANYTCCCPFHNEKTPSFSVNPTRQIYKCFGCGVGGNVFTFLQKYENMTFPEALKALADRAGIKLPEAQSSEEGRKRARRRIISKMLRSWRSSIIISLDLWRRSRRSISGTSRWAPRPPSCTISIMIRSWRFRRKWQAFCALRSFRTR